MIEGTLTLRERHSDVNQNDVEKGAAWRSWIMWETVGLWIKVTFLQNWDPKEQNYDPKRGKLGPRGAKLGPKRAEAQICVDKSKSRPCHDR